MEHVCKHEDADWPVEGGWLCTGCYLKMLLRMEEEEAAWGELATEAIQ